MKINFLGTAAAEGMPAVFCNCKYCNEARRLGGKNIRTRSQTLINDDLLIDLPADTYSHFLNNNILGDKIEYLLITHSHQDHCYPEELHMRNGPFAHDMQAPVLKVYCSKTTYDQVNAVVNGDPGVEINLVEPFKTYKLGEYEVTPLPARHDFGKQAVFYIIKGEKTVLYAHDTGYFYDEVFEFLKENPIKFDLVSMDCTNVNLNFGDDTSHMGIDQIGRVLKKMEDIGCVDDSTIKIINHFSHNGNPLHEPLQNQVDPLGYMVSFDGMKVEF